MSAFEEAFKQKLLSSLVESDRKFLPPQPTLHDLLMQFTTGSINFEADMVVKDHLYDLITEARTLVQELRNGTRA